jgi:hypothetical protein
MLTILLIVVLIVLLAGGIGSPNYRTPIGLIFTVLLIWLILSLLF